MPSVSHNWYTLLDCDSTDKDCYERWRQIHITAIVPTSISLFACCLIILLSILYLKDIRSNFVIGSQFTALVPLYISICDGIFHLAHGSDHVFSLINDHVAEGELCILFGSLKTLSINAQTLWAISVAYFVNHCIRHNGKTLEFGGKHNIGIHAICWGIPILIVIFGLSFDYFGIEGPWCGTINPTIDLYMVDLWIIVAAFMLFFLHSWTVYIIYSKIHNINRDTKKMEDAMKLLIWFPIAYVAQWTLFLLWKLHWIGQTWPQTIAVVTITNCGGIFNFILYSRFLFNSWKNKRETNKQMVAFTKQHVKSSVPNN